VWDILSAVLILLYKAIIREVEKMGLWTVKVVWRNDAISLKLV